MIQSRCAPFKIMSTVFSEDVIPRVPTSFSLQCKKIRKTEQKQNR